MPAGRPTDYSPELAATICARMTEGESLRAICRSDGMPCTTSVMLWLQKHTEFAVQYARAAEDRAHALAEEALEIADESQGDYYPDDEGNRVFDGEHVQRSRLRVDTRKWFAARLFPKKYGDRLQHANDPDSPIVPILNVRTGPD